MIEELKVGDKVYIREDLKNGEFYGSVSWQEENMKVGINTIISVYGRGICISEDIGYFYDCKMIDWEKTRDLNEKDKPTFDDLIDVAVKAQKYGLIHKVEIVGRRSLYLSEKPTSKALHYCLTSIDDGINYINSLYTETFAIESEEDIEKVKRGASISLANGSEFKASFVTQLSRGWVIDSILGNLNQTYCIFILKGATVTQKVK